MQLKALLLGAILLTLVASAAAAAPSPAPKANDDSTNVPMVFYVAKGEPDSCGEGCNEWIAAEGEIDNSTPQRLRALLNRLGKRKLPIYFHSPGGSGTAAMEIGRLLRQRELTAGVSRTIPDGCAEANAQACRNLKQSGEVLPSTLRSIAHCNSACVYVLIGAKVRQVPPGARLGVHSARVVVMRRDGHKINLPQRQIESYRKARLTELNAQLRRYVQEMKVDVRLYNLAASVPFESVHYLTRDEIVALGVDTRGPSEARWVATELLPQQFWTMKYFVEAQADDRKESHTSVIRLECGGAYGAKLSYFRSQTAQDTAAERRTIRFVAGDQVAALASAGSVFKMDAIESDTLYKLWTAHPSYQFLEDAAARDTVEIRESATADATPRITKLSTAGLAHAIETMRRRCGGTADCWTQNAAGTRAAICNVPSMTGR